MTKKPKKLTSKKVTSTSMWACIRNSDPGFPRCFVVFPHFSLVFPSNFKKCPDPERNSHISYHTAEVYGFLLSEYFQNLPGNYPTVDGQNFASILTQKFWTSFAHIFGIRCLQGDTRTFSQASRWFLAYVFRGILTFKRENLREKIEKLIF